MTDPLRLLVIGLGSIGRRHVTNLRQLEPDVHITALRHRPGQGQAEVGIDVTVHDMSEIAGTRFDGVLLTGPASQHVSAGLSLLANTGALFVEKPLAVDVASGLRLLAECDERGIPALGGYNFRQSAGMRTFREQVAARAGRILGGVVEVGQYLPFWRPGTDYREGVTAQKKLGGGALLELSHEIDTVRFIFGEVTSVFAHVRSTGALDTDVEDDVNLLLTLQTGATVSVHMDLLQFEVARHCKVIGESATLDLNLVDYTLQVTGREGSQKLIDLEEDRNDMYVAEMAHFVAVCRGATPVPESGARESLRTLAVVDAARRSAEAAEQVQVTQV